MSTITYQIEEEKKERRFRMPFAIMACLLVLLLAGGGTLAYLTAKTNEASNVFTAGNIKAELIEAAWTPKSSPDGTSGSEIAQKMLPGITAPKDPLIKNTSEIAENEYTGIMLVFEKATSVDGSGNPSGWGTMTEDEVSALLQGVGTTTTSGGSVTTAGLNVATNWGSRIDTSSNVSTVLAGQRVYLHNSTIAKDASTAAIFEGVGIIPQAGSETWDGDVTHVTANNFMTWLYDDAGCKGHFRITVKGAAVQATGVSQADAQDTVLTMFGYTTL